MWLENLAFFNKLEKMMTELPERFLKPESMDPPPTSDQKPAGHLTLHEKRLIGVINQLDEKIKIESRSHGALHNVGSNFPPEFCSKFKAEQSIRNAESNTVMSILLQSLYERLSLSLKYFDFHGDDIYAFDMEEDISGEESVTVELLDDPSFMLPRVGVKNPKSMN